MINILWASSSWSFIPWLIRGRCTNCGCRPHRQSPGGVEFSEYNSGWSLLLLLFWCWHRVVSCSKWWVSSAAASLTMAEYKSIDSTAQNDVVIRINNNNNNIQLCHGIANVSNSIRLFLVLRFQQQWLITSTAAQRIRWSDDDQK